MMMKKILLVEDEQMLLKSLTYFLNSNNYHIIAMDNGADAIAYIQSEVHLPDMVITDLNLPFAGGQQVIQAVRENSNNATPIIVLTSSGVEATELEVYDLGADEFISKPFSPAVLLKRIQKLMDKN